MKQLIAFNKKTAIVLSPTDPAILSEQINNGVIGSFNAELMKLGYTLSDKSIKILLQDTFELSTTSQTFKDFLTTIREEIGMARDYKPMYKNFPKEVMDKSMEELYFNAIAHYWSNGAWSPQSFELPREFEFEKGHFTEISIITEKEFQEIFTSLLSVSGILTDRDKSFIEWFVKYLPKDDLTSLIPPSIKIKEILSLLASYKIDVPIKTSTDVLRIAVALSGGDISLPKIDKTITAGLWKKVQVKNTTQYFKKFSRSERVYLLSLLEKCTSSIEEDMLKYRGRWIALGEIIHPGEYTKRFPKSAAAFSTLRNDEQSIKTFAARVESAIAGINKPSGYKSFDDLMTILSERPGEFARRLDFLLRNYNNSNVLGVFKTNIVSKVSSKVLIELLSHFKSRKIDSLYRMIVIKGIKSKTKIISGQKAFAGTIVDEVNTIIKDELKTRYIKDVSAYDSVQIHPDLYTTPFPTGMRGASSGIKTLIKGTQLPLGESNVIRGYLHWFDERGSIDLDLSTVFYSEDFRPVEQVSYTHLKSKPLNACHSGDIRHKKGACAEYIDVDINAALKAGVRYVLFQSHNFNGGGYLEIKDAVFGWMERERPEANKIFLPPTIENAIHLTSEVSTIFTVAFDLKNRTMIWLDTTASQPEQFKLNSVEGTLNKSTASLITTLNLANTKLTIGEFLELYYHDANNLPIITSTPPDAKTLVFNNDIDYTDVLNLL